MKNLENKRLHALDVVRGLTIILMIIVNTPGSWSHVYAPLLHAEWNGITPTDYVFPSFLFIVGVSKAYRGVVGCRDNGPSFFLGRSNQALLYRGQEYTP